MPLREQKKRDTQCASLFLLVAEVGLVTTGSRGNVCEVVCWVRAIPSDPQGRLGGDSAFGLRKQKRTASMRMLFFFGCGGGT